MALETGHDGHIKSGCGMIGSEPSRYGRGLCCGLNYRSVIPKDAGGALCGHVDWICT